MTKIDIISGFLGAGKTTLIKKLIGEALAGEKLVLIENEFGEIGIDGGFLKDAGIEITEMNSGCICCSLVGDFGTALGEVIEKYSPDRIIIEPSGVGKLSDVMKAVLDVKEKADIILNSTTVVVDCLKAKMYMKNFGEFFNNQVENAGCIILSRTQNATGDKLETCIELMRNHNENAEIVTTPWDDIDGATVLHAIEHTNTLDILMEEVKKAHDHEGHHHHEGECCHHDHEGHHHADDVFTSWGRETARVYGEAELNNALVKLAKTDEYGIVLRAKGMIPCDNGEWMYYDLTPGEYEIRKGQPDYTGKLCVIGTDLKEDKLEELFGLR